MKLLFVDSTVRPPDQSRTYQLAQAYLQHQIQVAEAQVTTCTLRELGLQPLTAQQVEERHRLTSTAQWNHPMFDLAKAFASADQIVIAAPYWDMSFPSLLKLYLEQICVSELTFSYNPEKMGKCCKAKYLVYITTAGGPIGDYNLGFQYVQGLCQGLLGIQQLRCITADGLDIVGADITAIIEEAIKRM